MTPRNAQVFADEPIYFLTKRTPPSGLELYYTHKLSLPPDESALLHILSEAEVKRLLQRESFATAVSCSDEKIAEYDLTKLYAQQSKMDDCTVFWDRKK